MTDSIRFDEFAGEYPDPHFGIDLQFSIVETLRQRIDEVITDMDEYDTVVFQAEEIVRRAELERVRTELKRKHDEEEKNQRRIAQALIEENLGISFLADVVAQELGYSSGRRKQP